MPSYTSGVLRDETLYVKVFAGQEVYYGFVTKDFETLTGFSATDTVALGHTLPNALPAGSLRFLRAQAPKPPRARKVINPNAGADVQKSISTFVGVDNQLSAEAQGWKISKRGRGVSLGQGRSVSAIAEVSTGAYYVFPLNRTDYNNYRTVLGLIDPGTINTATERSKLVRGSSRPRPGRASIRRQGGGTFTSFFSTSQTGDLLAAQWSILEQEYV